MCRDQFEANGRLGESRQLQTREDTTVGTGAGLRGGGLVDVTPVKLVRESKEGLTGRRRPPPRRAARYPASLNDREIRVAVTALPSPPVHQHIDPRRPAEPAAQRRVGVRSADWHNDDPSCPGWGDARSGRRMRDAVTADVFTAPLPIQTTELVPGLIPDSGVGRRLQAAVARGVARRRGLDRVGLGRQHQGAGLKPLVDPAFAHPLGGHGPRRAGADGRPLPRGPPSAETRGPPPCARRGDRPGPPPPPSG
jgi:hypothetical protein